MDKFKLEYEMRKKGVSMIDMAQMLGISRSALYRKMNGVTEFTLGEIQKIVDYLDLKTPVGIFFRAEVS